MSPFATFAVVLVLFLAMGGAYLAYQRTQRWPPLEEPTAQPLPGTTATSTVTTSDSVTPPPAVTSGEASGDPETEALTQLDALRTGDLASTPLNGQWAAQLASKFPGISDQLQTSQDGSHTFDAVDILAEHLALRQADNLGADVILLLSSDFGKRSDEQSLWVTLAVGSFRSADAVKSWCADRFPALTGDELRNTCVPRTLKPPYPSSSNSDRR